MNCKQLLLLCLLYKCSGDETGAITEGCFVVPASWLSLGRLAALPVTSLFKRKGSTSMLVGSYWPLICGGSHPEGVLSISTFQGWLHFSEMNILLRIYTKWMIGVCLSCSSVTIAILPSYVGSFLWFQKAVWYLERRNLAVMSLLQPSVPGAEKPFDGTTSPSTAKPSIWHWWLNMYLSPLVNKNRLKLCIQKQKRVWPHFPMTMFLTVSV